MIWPIHQTIKVNTMSHSKHVAGLMGHYTSRSPEDFVVFRNVLLSLKKSWIISRKWENPCPIFYTCESKDKIPLILRIKIRYCDSYQAKSIRLKFILQLNQYLLRIVLRLLCIFVDSSIYSIQYIWLLHYLNFEGIEKTLTEIP